MICQSVVSRFRLAIAAPLDTISLVRTLKSYGRWRQTSVGNQRDKSSSEIPVWQDSHALLFSTDGTSSAASQEIVHSLPQASPPTARAASLPAVDLNSSNSPNLVPESDVQRLTFHPDASLDPSIRASSLKAVSSADYTPTLCLPLAATKMQAVNLAAQQLYSASHSIKNEVEESRPSFQKESDHSGLLLSRIKDVNVEGNAATNIPSEPGLKPGSLASFTTSGAEQTSLAQPNRPSAALTPPETAEAVGIGNGSNSYLDVRAFGAVGDGVTDDSAAIQAAELAASAQNKELFFGPGTYLINEKIYLHSNDALVGSGFDTTLKMGSSLDTMFALNGSPADQNGSVSPIRNVRISSIQFDGSAGSNLNEGPLVVCYIADGISFSDDGFSNANGIGILLSNTENSVVNNCSFSNIGNKPLITSNLGDAAQGVAFCDSSILNSANNVVENSIFSAIGLDAISASDQNSFTVSKNIMLGLNVLSGWNHYSAGAAGVYLTNNSKIVATGNFIEGASGNGFDLDNNSNVIISDNTVSASGSGGIVIAHTTDAVISGNTSTNNNQYLGYFANQSGISITGNANQPSSNIQVQGNRVGDTQTRPTQNFGFQIVAGTPTSNIEVSGNYFDGNAIAPSNVTIDNSQNFISLGLQKEIMQYVTGTVSLTDAGFSVAPPMTSQGWNFTNAEAQSPGAIPRDIPQAQLIPTLGAQNP